MSFPIRMGYGSIGVNIIIITIIIICAPYPLFLEADTDVEPGLHLRPQTPETLHLYYHEVLMTLIFYFFSLCFCLSLTHTSCSTQASLLSSSFLDRFVPRCRHDLVHLRRQRRGGLPQQHHAGGRRLQLRLRLVLLHCRRRLLDLRDRSRRRGHAVLEAQRQDGGHDSHHPRPRGQSGPGARVHGEVWGAQCGGLPLQWQCLRKGGPFAFSCTDSILIIKKKKRINTFLIFRHFRKSCSFNLGLFPWNFFFYLGRHVDLLMVLRTEMFIAMLVSSPQKKKQNKNKQSWTN